MLLRADGCRGEWHRPEYMNHIYPANDTSSEIDRPSGSWPAHTTHTSTDVIVAAISITRLVDWCGTPCVHSAEADAHFGARSASDGDMDSVVVTRVLAIEWRSDLRLHVTIDADLSRSRPTMDECRIIGHDVDGAVASVTLEAHGADGLGFAAELPAKIAVGDLIAIPCRGVSRLHDLRVTARQEAVLTPTQWRAVTPTR